VIVALDKLLNVPGNSLDQPPLRLQLEVMMVNHRCASVFLPWSRMPPSHVRDHFVEAAMRLVHHNFLDGFEPRRIPRCQIKVVGLEQTEISYDEQFFFHNFMLLSPSSVALIGKPVRPS
jgi:hypothetical protein